MDEKLYYTEQETWNGANLNLEFEAHFAQQIFIEQMSENEWKLWKERTKFDSRWKAVRDLKNYIDNHGRLLPGITENDLQDEFMKHTIDGFRRVGYDNLDYSWLSSRKGSKKLSKIQKITIDCNK